MQTNGLARIGSVTSPFVILAGEPILAMAILAAARQNGARYVTQYDGVEGWHVSDVMPRHTGAFFRVSGKIVTVRTKDGNEARFGRVVDGKIVQETQTVDLKRVARPKP